VDSTTGLISGDSEAGLIVCTDCSEEIDDLIVEGLDSRDPKRSCENVTGTGS
jgi:hypothetical protein